jgi:hypothetical protein
MIDYLRYFDRELYVFEDVHSHFHTDHSLSAFDFFSIIIWKANRAKSKIASKLLKQDPLGRHDLDAICRDLTASLYSASGPNRLRVLVKDWDFALPMASAILAVCWPDEFPVYDYRIRGQIQGFQKINKSWDFERIWTAYEEYKAKVCALMPEEPSLRRKDRYLYGKSNALQLTEDIERLFGVLDK